MPGRLTSPHRITLLEKGLVLLLAASFALPLAAGLLLRLPPVAARVPGWVRNRTLSGAPVPPEPVAPGRSTLFSASYQAAVADSFNAHFVGREMLIRGIDEFYLRAFHATPIGVLVGPNRSLVEPIYADDYCLLRGDGETLRPLVEDLRRMQDFCDARGTAFALVITPSKAAVYPENLPANWLRRFRPEPRYYDEFVTLLREKGVRAVDGHRIAVEMKRATAVPVFPLGGIHWGDPAALATANAVLEQLAGCGLQVKPMRDSQTEVSADPKGQDRDLVSLINIVFPWHYPVARVTPLPVSPPPSYRPNVVCIGGSFAWKLLSMLDASGQFSELDQYFYYGRSKSCQVDGEKHEIAKPAPPIHFDTDVFAADALVLEVNEQTLHTPAAHLTSFLHDALAVLPDPHAPRAPFHYESRMDYHWGDTLSFVANQHPVSIGSTRGFTTPGADGSRTVGPVASLHFVAPPPAQDMVLEVEAGAFLVDRRLPAQRISVSANGHAVGEWVWTDPQPSRRELVIPKEFLGGGQISLEFRVARPGSPAEFGLGRDTRKYGMIVSSIRLRAAGSGTTP